MVDGDYYVLKDFLEGSYEDNFEKGIDIIFMIRTSPQSVCLTSCRLTDDLDDNYWLEFSSLPDYNLLPAYKKAVLSATWRFIRQRQAPFSRFFINHALVDMTFLELLHSTLLTSTMRYGMPRAIIKWSPIFSQDESDLVMKMLVAPALAMQCMQKGDQSGLYAVIATNKLYIPGWVTSQVPSLGGWNLLHCLASLSSLSDEQVDATVSALFKFNLPFNSTDYHGNTALHIACLHFNLPCIKVLTSYSSVAKTASNGNGFIPLQVFLHTLATFSQKSEIDFRQVSHTIKFLLPLEDCRYLFANCSYHRFCSGLAICLLFPNRDLGYAVCEWMKNSISRDSAMQDYPVLLDALVRCIRSRQNHFYHQLLELLKCCQPIYTSFPKQLHWEIYSVMVISGIYAHNSTAVWWAIDHVSLLLDCEDNTHSSLSSSHFPLPAVDFIPWKLCLYLAVFQEEDRILNAMLKKLPVDFVFPLVTQVDKVGETAFDVERVISRINAFNRSPTKRQAQAPGSASKANQSLSTKSQLDSKDGSAFSLEDFMKQHFAFLSSDATIREIIEDFSLLSLAAVLGNKLCLKVLLKFVSMNCIHFETNILKANYRMAILQAAIHDQLGCLEALREGLGVEEFSRLCFMRVKGHPSVFDYFLANLREKWLCREGIPCNMDPLPPLPSSHKSNTDNVDHTSYRRFFSNRRKKALHLDILSFFLQGIHLHSFKDSLQWHLGHRPHSIDLFVERTAKQNNFLSSKLQTQLLARIDNTFATSVLIKFLVNSNDRCYDSFLANQCLARQWVEMNDVLKLRSYDLRVGLRRIIRGSDKFIPSLAWQKLGYAMITLFDVVEDGKGGRKRIDGETESLTWRAFEKLITGIMKNKATFTAAMEKLLQLRKRPFSGNEMDPYAMDRGLSREQWQYLRHCVQDPHLLATFQSKGDGGKKADKITKQNIYEGENSISYVYTVFDQFLKLIVEEGRLWYEYEEEDKLFQDSCQRTVEPNRVRIESTVEEKLSSSSWFQSIRSNMLYRDWLVALAAYHDIEYVRYYDYFNSPPDMSYNLLSSFLEGIVVGQEGYKTISQSISRLEHFRYSSFFLGLSFNSMVDFQWKSQANEKTAIHVASYEQSEKSNSYAIMLEDIVCKLIDANRFLFSHMHSSGNNLYAMHSRIRESLLRYLLPLSAMRCYRAAKNILTLYSAYNQASTIYNTSSDMSSHNITTDGNDSKSESNGGFSNRHDLVVPASGGVVMPSVDEYHVNYNFMSHFGSLVIKNHAFEDYSDILKRYQSNLLQDDYYGTCWGGYLQNHPMHWKEILEEGVETIELITPVHFALYHRHYDFLTSFCSTFPLFTIPLLSFVRLVENCQLYDIALGFINSIENIYHTFFIPSILSSLDKSAKISDVGSIIKPQKQMSRMQSLFYTATTCLVSSYWHSTLYNNSKTSDNGNFYNNLNRFMAAYGHHIMKKTVAGHSQSHYDTKTNLSTMSQINLSRDMRIRMMDGNYIFVNKIVNNVNNLVRALPSIQLNLHYHLIHCIMHVLVRKESSDLLEEQDYMDLLEVLLFQEAIFLPFQNRSQAENGVMSIAARMSFSLDENGYPPILYMLKKRYYRFSNQILKQAVAYLQSEGKCEVQNSYGGDLVVLRPKDKKIDGLYEYLITRNSIQEQLFSTTYLFDIDGIVLCKYKDALASLRKSPHHRIDLLGKAREYHLTSEVFLGTSRFLSFQEILSQIIIRKEKSEVDLTDPMILLNLILQYSQYIYNLLTEARIQPKWMKKNPMIMNENISYFLQYSMAEAYSKLDVFVRARQVLSLLNMPFSSLCCPSTKEDEQKSQEEGKLELMSGTPSPKGSMREQGSDEVKGESRDVDDTSEKLGGATQAGDALLLCQNISKYSHAQLKQIICGFFRLRLSLSDQKHGDQYKAKTNKQHLPSAAIDGFLSWHCLWMTCVSLGSSGLSVSQYLKKCCKSKVVVANKKIDNLKSSENPALRPLLESYDVYKYQTNLDWMSRDQQYDLLQVIETELAASVYAGALPSTLLGSGGMRTVDRKGLTCALDTAYLILDLARALCLARTLLVVTQETMLPSSPSSSSTIEEVRAKYFQNKPHPLYREQQDYSFLLGEKRRLLSALQGKAVYKHSSGDGQVVGPAKPSVGMHQRIAIMDGLSADQLRLFFRFNSMYSERLNKLRQVIAQGLASLLLDLGHPSLSEVVCRMTIQAQSGSHNLVPSGLVVPPSPNKPSPLISPTSSNAGWSATSFARLNDSSDTCAELLTMLQAFYVDDFLHPVDSPVIKEKYKRFRKYFDGISPCFEESKEGYSSRSKSEKDSAWQQTINDLREGVTLTPTSEELKHLYNVFESIEELPGDQLFVTETKLQLSRREQMMLNGEKSLYSALLTASRLYWLLCAIYGLLLKGSTGSLQEDISLLLRSAKESISNGDYSTHAQPLLTLVDFEWEGKINGRKGKVNDHERTACATLLVQLGYSVNSSLNKSSPLSLVEMAALRGDSKLLKALFRPYEKVDETMLLESTKMTLHKTLIFHTLLAMPSARNVVLSISELNAVRQNYTECIQLLLTQDFPVFSPRCDSLSCLDLVVLKEAWPLLSSIYHRCNIDSQHPALTTSETVDMRFSVHWLAMLGLASKLGSCHNKCQQLVEAHGNEVLNLLQKHLLSRNIFSKRWTLQNHLLLPELEDVFWISHGKIQDDLHRFLPPIPAKVLFISSTHLRQSLVQDVVCLGLSSSTTLPPSLRKDGSFWKSCPIQNHFQVASVEYQSVEEINFGEGFNAIELAARSGDGCLVEMLFDKFFPKSVLYQAADLAATNQAETTAPHVKQLLTLIAMACVYGFGDILEALDSGIRNALVEEKESLGKKEQGRDGEKLEGNSLRAALWFTLLSGSLCQSSSNLQLDQLVQCSHTEKALKVVFDIANDVSLLGYYRPLDKVSCREVLVKGVCRGLATEGHLCILFNYLVQSNNKRGARDEESVDYLVSISSLTSNLLANGETLLHVICRRGLTELALLWINLIGAHLTTEDEAGLTPLHVSIASGHGRITAAFKPHLPASVIEAVKTITLYMRILRLQKYSEPDLYLAKRKKWQSFREMRERDGLVQETENSMQDWSNTSF